MQIAALRYFLEVARLGSIRQAAETLNVAASALSRQIANLEAEFGADLFERHAQGVRPTAAGMLFAQHARDTLGGFDRLRSDLGDLAGLKRGTVRLATVEGAVTDLLYGALARFEADHPGIRFEVDVAGTSRIVERLALGEADLGLAFGLSPDPEIMVSAERAYPLVGVVPPDHPLGAAASLSLMQLTEQRLCLPPRGFGTRRLIDEAAARQGVVLAPALTINSIEMVKAYVLAGRGVAILPSFAIAADCAAGRLLARPVADLADTPSRLSLCRPSERALSAAAMAFETALAARMADDSVAGTAT